MASTAPKPKSAQATSTDGTWEVVDSAGRRHAKGTYEAMSQKFSELAHDNLQTARFGGLTLRRVPTGRR